MGKGPAAHSESRTRFPARHHLRGRVATAVLSAAAIVVAGAVWLPATAQADEGITSFKTTLIETNAPLNEAGEVAAAGTISEPGPESFTVETLSGQTVTVEVPVHQFENDAAFTDPNQPATVIALSADTFPHVPVESGDHVVVFGARSGATVTATTKF